MNSCNAQSALLAAALAKVTEARGVAARYCCQEIRIILTITTKILYSRIYIFFIKVN